MFSSMQLPQSRLSRLAKLGRLAGAIYSGALSEGARQLGQGQKPSMSSMLLNTNNATRLTDRLSEMRGAAMKMGQLLSMESGEMIPKELSEALTRLREQAHAMPLGEVAQVLEQSWGKGWDKRFRRFNFQPLAAASIGQVHEAQLKDGRRLAIKIQYPGVRRSIDSDVDNVTALLRVLNLLPKTMDFEPLLKEAKRQLHAEADYHLEASCLRRFADCVADDPRFEVPGVVDDLTTAEVLAMHYLDGEPIESLSEESPAIRNRTAASLLELSLREVLEWVPELAKVDTPWIHTPWLIPPDMQRAAGCVIGENYPAPLVDHEKAARQAREHLYTKRRDSEARRESRGIFDRLWSRKRNAQRTAPRKSPGSEADWRSR